MRRVVLKPCSPIIEVKEFLLSGLYFPTSTVEQKMV